MGEAEKSSTTGGGTVTLRAARASQDLIETHQGIVKSLAWKIHRKLPPHVDLDDLVAYGQVGLAQAARDFDPSRGGQFTTYAYYRIRGAIFDGLSKMSWFSRWEYHAARYEQRASELLEVQSAADDDSAARREDGVRWLSETVATFSIAYLASDEALSRTMANPAMTDCAEPSQRAIDREICQKLMELIDGLPAEAGTLIRAAYFEGVTLTEAGRRIGVSKAWASRLHARTLKRLAHALRLLGVGDE